ncbi:Leucine-rich repeat protein [Rickettsiales bacterium Ac37b]|nr:Leucine-rich repeat protein [Rickettsiales bacterium Ac37b]
MKYLENHFSQEKERKSIRKLSNNNSCTNDICYLDHYSSKEEIQNIIKKLSDNDPSITKIYINISNNYILTSLCEAIKHNKFMIFCEFKCDIPNFYTQYITNILKENKSLNTFNLNHSKFSSEDIEEIAQALSANTNITYFSLEGTSLTSEAITSIISTIRNHKSIKSLNLSSTVKKVEHKQSLLTALKFLLTNNSKLQTLHLTNNMFNNEDIIDLAPSLMSNKSLLTLSLASNNIGLKGMQVISQTLTKSNLRDLDLSGPIDTEEVFSMDNKNFMTNEFNYLGDKGLVALMDVLSINDNIISLNLSDNFSLSNQGFSVITKYLRNSSLNILKITLPSHNNCDFSRSIIDNLATFIKNNKNLITLETTFSKSTSSRELKRLLENNYKEASKLADLIVKGEILNQNEVKNLLERKSAVIYILLTEKVDKLPAHNVNEKFVNQLLDNSLDKSHLGKHTLSLLTVSNDLNNSPDLCYLKKLPKPLLNKIFSYNIFTENAALFPKNLEIITNNFLGAIKNEMVWTLKRYLEFMHHQNFNSLIETGKQNTNHPEILKLLDAHIKQLNHNSQKLITR